MIEPLASVGVMTPPTSSMDLGFWDFFFFFFKFHQDKQLVKN